MLKPAPDENTNDYLLYSDYWKSGFSPGQTKKPGICIVLSAQKHQ
jgi:hypothetical protein